MKKKTSVLIMGAGVSGMSAAHELNKRGIDNLVLEANSLPGGLSRSIHIGEAVFDYTGHFLHLSHWESPADIPFANQDNADWQRVRRDSKVFFKNNFISAPFQYNLHQLPKNEMNRHIRSYMKRPCKNKAENFKEYLLGGFGKEICASFLYPYNEKILATDLTELSTDSVKRFFPHPNENRIVSGRSALSDHAEEYNSSFWYPVRQGIGLLTRGLSRNLKNMHCAIPVLKIDLKNREARTPQGNIQYDWLINSAPLKNFCELTNDSELIYESSRLSNSKVLCLNLMLEGKIIRPELQKAHWIYIPQKDIPFYRVGIYSNIKDFPVPTGHVSLYIEAGFSDREKLPDLVKEKQKIIEKIKELKWFAGEIRTVSASWINCAYVHFSAETKEAVPIIKHRLKKLNCDLIGRYGLWDYISMEDSILSGIFSAKRIGG